MHKDLIGIYGKVLDSMASSRAKFKHFNSWHEAYAVIKESMENIHDSLLCHELRHEHELKLESELINLTANCLCAISECSEPNFRWVDVFDELTKLISRLEYSGDDYNVKFIFDELITPNFEYFWEEVKGGIINTNYIYTVAAYSVVICRNLIHQILTVTDGMSSYMSEVQL